MSPGGPAVAAVLPVGGDSELLRECLDCLRGQERPVDELIVVDDSPDGALGEVKDARVLRTHGRGPYAARNAGWREAEAGVILFLDVRSRPRPDWSRRLAACFDDPDVAVAGSGVQVLGGDTAGARAGGRHQFFELSKYQERAFFRPYFPTCNLAARREDLLAVGGFREVRSGGDADLCWRILDRPGRRQASVDEVLMEWVPRDRLRGYLEQNYRYGRSNRSLRRAWQDAGAPQAEPWSRPLLARRVVRRAADLAIALTRRDRELVDIRVRQAARVAFEAGYRVRPGRDAAQLGAGPKAVRLLFIDQGRGSKGAALGHGRVAVAVRVGLEGQDARGTFASVPPMTRLLRMATRSVRALGAADLWSLRYVLARGWLARGTLRQGLRQDHPDVVQMTTDQIAFLLGRLRSRVPVVLSLDSLYVEWNRMTHRVPQGRPTPWHLRPIAWLERRALARAPLVVAWTQNVATDVRAAVPTARVHVLHPGLDLEAFRPAEDRVDSEHPRVLFVGGRWRAKGGPELMDALDPRLGEDVFLDVVTPEAVPARPGVTSMAAEPGSDDLHEAFRRADVFCLPTTVDACPWVVLEAMAYGLPVVSTRVGSIPELVGDGGIVVQPGDHVALRAALFGLLDDPGRRTLLGRQGRARVEACYDARVNGPALIELLAGVAGRAGPQ